MTEINFVFLQCVFHSIRFKVNKRLEYSGTPFLCLHLIGKKLNRLSRFLVGIGI